MESTPNKKEHGDALLARDTRTDLQEIPVKKEKENPNDDFSGDLPAALREDLDRLIRNKILDEDSPFDKPYSPNNRAD